MNGTTEAFARVKIEANHPNLTNQEMLDVEISRARDRAELVSDDKAGLKEQLEERSARIVQGHRRRGPGVMLEPPGTGRSRARDARMSRRKRRSRSPRNAIWGCEAYASSGMNYYFSMIM